MINVGRRSILAVLLLIAGGVVTGFVIGAIRTQRVENELLRLSADEVSSHENLVAVWLFGEGRVSDIENTIQYGVRSGHPQGHNVTDMPAFLRSGQLSKEEITDVVDYVLAISGRPHDEAAAQRGSDLYQNKGNCFDCHGGDALGKPDYGAPALTGPAWVYGGSRSDLVKSVSKGRHGLCPSWIDKVPAADIRALAVYLHAVSHDIPER